MHSVRRPIRSWLVRALTPGVIALRVVLPAVRPLDAAESADFPKIYNTQAETIPLLKPEEALQRIHLPPGFQATLFAGEPDVQQPIGMTTDARGRLWVAENYTYSERTLNFDPKLRDRIVILSDTNHDGRFDQRTVFWDRAQKLTSVAVGFGGVFALCPPQLLFIPDRNGDDVPDGEPEVLLDGWDDNVIRHTIVNGLKWGPDGWLYGRHGIQATSLVGAPGTPRDQRTPINVGLWRYHPVTHAFEVIAQGTTNPWGHDWDDHGQLFFINTVIGHLWHVVPGAYYRRMYGEHATPHLYELIEQTADHFHWDTKENWADIRKLGVTSTTSQAGGGHAHVGLMFYLGDNWPASYRDTLFTVNFHGQRLNNDRLERRGAGYVAHHAADFLTSGDPWFRGLDVLAAPDGGVFVSDWSDIGECHDHDGIHRTSGRIYKITYGTPAPPAFADLTKLSDAELVKLQLHANEWLVRQSRQVLQERAVRGAKLDAVHAALREMFATQRDDTRQLRALWSLHVTGGAPESWLRGLLRHPSEHVRVWAIQLLLDQRVPSAELTAEFARLTREDASGLVLSFLASAMQRLAPAARWPLAEGLATRAEFAADPMLPLLTWYGLEPAVSLAPERALVLATSSRVPKLRRFIARRLAEDFDTNPAVANRLVELLRAKTDAAFQTDLLGGLADGLGGRRKVTPPPAWAVVSPALAQSADETVRKLTRELAVVFGDGRAADELRTLVSNPAAETTARRRALEALLQSRADGLQPILQRLLTERDLAPDAVRGLAALGDPSTPQLLLKSYAGLPSNAARAEVINTLASRPAFAIALLDAVQNHAVPRPDVGPFQVRQMRGFDQDAINRRLTEFWPELRPLSGEKLAQLARYRQLLTPEKLAAANAAQGRQLFSQACGVCHTLYGEGGKIGPDLTGADRKNLDYLLDNILDPSGVVPEGYRVSVLNLKDGRVLNGMIVARTERALTVQTVTEKIVIERGEVEAIAESQLSMMPEGLLEAYDAEQVRALVAYLMSPGQVPLPAGANANGR